ncbi:MAG: hypothetical protein QOE60_2963 [Thermoleophilaceae bacterium]|nr:hypothetical protein [Thermoleophilaceae bacterium]
MRAFVFRRHVRRAAGALLAAAIAAYLLHVVAGVGDSSTDPVFSKWVFLVTMYAAAFGCLLRPLLVETNRRAWTALGVALACWAAGNTYTSLVLASDPSPPLPSPADVLYLLYYPCAALGVALLIRARVVQHRLAVWLDGLTGALAGAAVCAAVLLPPILDSGQDTAALITTLAYPFGDMLLLSVVLAGLTVGEGRAGRAWYLLCGGFVMSILTDAFYLHRISDGTYTTGSLLEAGWMTAVGLVAVAAWQKPQGAPAQRRSQRGLVAPLGCAIGAIGLSAYGVLAELNAIAAGLTAITLLVVVVRLALTLFENRTLLVHTEREATTDALSGLGNRRLLMPALERACASSGSTLVLYDLDGFKRYNDTYGHPAGDALLQRLSRRLDAAARDHGGSAYRMGGDEFCVLLPTTGPAAEAAIEATVAALCERGEGFVVTTSYGSLELPEEASDAVDAMRLADQRLYGRKSGRRSGPHVQARAALRQVIDEAEPELGRHGQGVAELATEMGRRFGMDPERRDELARAAELHDVGKVAIPDEILHKAGTLTEEEWKLVREHTVIGERIIAAAPALAPVARIVRWTHERWDGQGYPDCLAGDAIPLAARLIAVCDAYDAMTRRRRPHRTPLSSAAALAELQRCAGTQFDPAAVAAFAAMLAELGPAPTSSEPAPA